MAQPTTQGTSGDHDGGYESPRLESLGSVHDLTLGFESPGGDMTNQLSI